MILRYSKENDWVLDQFLGSGTTLIEAKLLNRNGIGVDINPHAILLSQKNIHFTCENDTKTEIRLGSATNLNFIKNQSIDLVCMHPPYADIIKYSEGIEGDLSQCTFEKFVEKMRKVADEAYRVLREKGHCAFMIGDTRYKGRVQPLGFKTMQTFIDAGFVLKEIIIKEQHNCRSTPYWRNKKRRFLMLAHEYVFVFEK